MLFVHVVAVLQWCVHRGGITGNLEVHQHVHGGAGSAVLAVPARTPCFDDVLQIACEWEFQALFVHALEVPQWCVHRGGIIGSLEVHQHVHGGAVSAVLAVPARTQCFDDVLPIACDLTCLTMQST